MRVGFFVTCLVDLMRPSIGFAAIRLLETGGASVFVPPRQTCCGQPGYNAGDRAGAKALAARVVAEFEGCEYLVAPSGSCSGMIKTHYAELFDGDAAMRARVDALAAMWRHLLSASRVEISPNLSAKVPPKPQQVSLSAISLSSSPGTRASSSRGWPLTPISRSPEQESW